MGQPKQTSRRVEPLDRERLEERLRGVVSELLPGRVVDDLEVRHLIRVITECSLLLTDVYSEDRIGRIMRADRGELSRLVDGLIASERRGDGAVLYRVRRLPDDVRVVGDKALFDMGLRGLTEVRGCSLGELGARAYRLASETLELLAEDHRLRDFFKQNRLLMLPLEQEVIFLKQCSEKFPVYASILSHINAPGPEPNPEELALRVPLMAAAAEALGVEGAAEEPPGAPDESNRYFTAIRAGVSATSLLSKKELLSAYERMVLFSALDLARLRQALKETVVDQVEAVDALCDEFSLFAAGTGDLRKPPAFFLVGPTGVGKNHLTESLCRVLEGVWDVEVPVLSIEGPNYTYASDINELRGATRGFIRSDEEGLLSSFHERSSRAPLSVILVDEVEKAHPQLRKFFLSIMDRGTTTDNRGQLLNFFNTIIFFTSNLGYSDAQLAAAPIGYMDDEARVQSADQDVRRTVRRSLTPEFMNRVRMLHFRRLTRSSAERILDLELDKIRRRYQEVHGLALEVTPRAREELMRAGFSSTFGARHLAAVLDRVCNVEVAKKVRRDDRGGPTDRDALVRWLRELRAGERAFELEEVKQRVLEATRARLGYGAIRIDHRDDRFHYEGTPSESTQ